MEENTVIVNFSVNTSPTKSISEIYKLAYLLFIQKSDPLLVTNTHSKKTFELNKICIIYWINLKSRAIY